MPNVPDEGLVQVVGINSATDNPIPGLDVGYVGSFSKRDVRPSSRKIILYKSTPSLACINDLSDMMIAAAIFRVPAAGALELWVDPIDDAIALVIIDQNIFVISVSDLTQGAPRLRLSFR